MFALQAIGGIKISKRFSWTGYTKEKNVPPKYTYFTPGVDKIEGLNEDFLAKLDQARHLAGIPFVITSGFRTPEENQSVPGSVSDSSHIKGLAVDLRATNSHDVSLICDSVKTVGITRRIIYVDRDFEPVHVHVDVDPDKVSDVIKVSKEPKSWADESTTATV